MKLITSELSQDDSFRAISLAEEVIHLFSTCLRGGVHTSCEVFGKYSQVSFRPGVRIKRITVFFFFKGHQDGPKSL